MASGNTLFTLVPQSSEPPTSTYALFTVRNAILYLDFDASTIWSTVFSAALPSHYSGGGLTIDVYWIAASATSGDVVWGISLERDNEGNHDLDTDAFATEQTATGTANGTSGKVTKTTITVSSGSNMDSATTGDPVRLKLRRVATSGSDTMTGNAEFRLAHVKET